MKILGFLTRTREKKEISSFADFFLHASDKKKKEVFTDAARRANEDQRLTVEQINKFHRKAT